MIIINYLKMSMKKMKLNKFRHGDLVANPYGTKCTVKSICKMQPEIEYIVIFTHSPQVEKKYKENELKFWQDGPPPVKEPDTYPDACPNCGGPWKKTGFGQKVWLDCPKCNEKAEELCRRYPYKASKSNHSYNPPKLDIDDLADVLREALDLDDDYDIF